jgi:hypothetical protein
MRRTGCGFALSPDRRIANAPAGILVAHRDDVQRRAEGALFSGRFPKGYQSIVSRKLQIGQKAFRASPVAGLSPPP